MKILTEVHYDLREFTSGMHKMNVRVVYIDFCIDFSGISSL